MLVARPARAEDSVGLTWEAPPSCPSESTVRDAIQQWLSEPGAVDLRSIHVVARVRPHPSGFVLDLSFESKSGAGKETLVAARCETLADIVALKVALAADPIGILETSEPETTTPRVVRRTSPARVEYAARVSVGAGFGPLPGVGPAASVVGAVVWRSGRIELGAGYWSPETTTYELRPDIGAYFSLAAAMLRACATPKLGNVEFPVCSGLEAGDLRGEGFGVDRVETADRPWLGLSLGPAVSIPLASQLFLWLEGDAVLGLVRPAGYGVRNLGTLYGPEIGAARAWAGLEVRFW